MTIFEGKILTHLGATCPSKITAISSTSYMLGLSQRLKKGILRTRKRQHELFLAAKKAFQCTEPSRIVVATEIFSVLDDTARTSPIQQGIIDQSDTFHEENNQDSDNQDTSLNKQEEDSSYILTEDSSGDADDVSGLGLGLGLDGFSPNKISSHESGAIQRNTCILESSPTTKSFNGSLTDRDRLPRLLEKRSSITRLAETLQSLKRQTPTITRKSQNTNKKKKRRRPKRRHVKAELCVLQKMFA